MANLDSERSTVFLERFLADPKNAEAFGQFARKYGPRIKARCQACHHLQDFDADDLTADILLHFFEKDRLEAFVFSTKAAFDAWLRVVVHNACADFHRRRQVGVRAAWSLGDADAQDALLNVAAVTDAVGAVCAEDRALVERARVVVRARVAAVVWSAFALCVDDGLPAKAVAARLGLKPAQVHDHASRVKMLLRREVRRRAGV